MPSNDFNLRAAPRTKPRAGGRAALSAGRLIAALLLAAGACWPMAAGLGGLSGLLPGAFGQGVENPAFVTDSPVAADMLVRVGEHIAAGNDAQAARLLATLLAEQPHAMVASRADAGLFLTVRAVAHALLVQRPNVAARYAEMVEGKAAELLASGGLEVLERSYWFTVPGYQGSVKLAAEYVARAEFDAATLVLLELSAHPLASSPACAEARVEAAGLAGVLARVHDGETLNAVSRAYSVAAGAGQGIARPPGAGVRSLSSWQAGPPGALGQLVAMPLTSAAYSAMEPLNLARLNSSVFGQRAEGNSSDDQQPIPPFARLLRSMPMLVGKTAYGVGGLRLVSIDLERGGLRWATDLATTLPGAAFGAAGLRRNEEAGAQMSGSMFEDVAALAFVPSGGVEGAAGREGVVVTAVHDGVARNGPSAEALVGLDAKTGSVRWSVAVESLDRAMGAGVLVRAPAMVSGSTVVVGLRKAQLDRRLNALYMVGLDAFSGRRMWSVSIGSAGVLPYSRSVVPADGGVVREGVVYRADRIGVVFAIAAHDGRVLWARRGSAEPLDNNIAAVIPPYKFAVPIVHGEHVFVLSADRRSLLRFGLRDGSPAGSIRSEWLTSAFGLPQYIVATATTLGAVGDTRVGLLKFADFEAVAGMSAKAIVDVQAALRGNPGVPANVVQPRQVVFTRAADGAGIRGRVGVAGEQLAIPTATGLMLVDVERPQQAVGAWQIDSPGNVLIDGARLIVADDARLHTYGDWPTSKAQLLSQLQMDPGNAGPARQLVMLAYRSGQHAELPGLIDQAAKAIAAAKAAGESSADAAEIERYDLLDALLGIVEYSELALAGQASPNVPVLSGEVLAMVLKSSVALVLTKAERASVSIGLANIAARDKRWVGVDGAVALLHGVLADVEQSAAQWRGPRRSYRIDAEATRLLQAAMPGAGRSAFAGVDAEAQQELTALAASTEVASFERLAGKYPVSPAAPRALLRAGDLLVAQGRMRAGVRALEQGLTLALATPDAERATVAELGGRLIGQLVPAGALGGAGDTLALIDARFPGLVLRDAKGPIDLAAIKADLAGRMSLSRRWPTAGLPTATDPAQVLQGWALIDPMLKPTAGGVPPLVAMRHADGRLAVFGVPAADGPAGELLTPRWTLDRSDGMEVVKLDAKTVLLFDRDGAVLQRASVVEGVDDGWLAKPFSEYFLAQGGEAGGGGRPGKVRPGGLPRARATFSAQGFRAPGDMFRPYEELLICATDRTIAIVERTGRAVLLDAISGGLLFAGEIGLRQVHDVQLAGTSLIAAGVARDERAGAGAPVDGAGMDVILVVDARSGAMVRSITPSADLGGVRWVRTNERADIIAGCAKGIASFDPETAAVGWSLLSSDSPAAAATDAWLVGSRLVLLADDRRMYLANTTAGQITPQVLNIGSRAESYGPIYVSRSMLAAPLGQGGAGQGGAGQGGAGQAGAGVGGGALIPPGSELVAIRSSNGLAIIDVDGRVVGGDAISSSETVLPPVPIDGGYLAIARESKGDVTGGGVGGAGKQLAPFELTLLDGRSGAAMATVSLMLGAVPARMAVIDNRVIVTAGHTSVVYKTK